MRAEAGIGLEIRGQAFDRTKAAAVAKLAFVIHRRAPDRQRQGAGGLPSAARAEEEFEYLSPDAAPKIAEKPRRGRPKGTRQWVLATGHLTDLELAELIVTECVAGWLFSKADDPPVTSVAKAIGWRLGVPAEKRARVGRALLFFAEEAGIAERLRAPRNGVVPTLRLTLETMRALDELYALLLKSNIGRRYGVTYQPMKGVPSVRKKWNQKIRPTRKALSSVPVRAAHRVQHTRWSVDPWMMNVVDQWLRTEEPRLIGKWKGSRREHKRVLKLYSKHLFALKQAQTITRPFYFPVRFDHRGRIHQVGGALTYTGGSDAARAMLQFAEAKRVTEKGRDWLARHLINQFSGEESRSVPLGGELAWIEKHRDIIEFTAADPINTRAWERAAEKTRFRFIAACRAWVLAEQNQPVALPVAVDASASVLQHMALLLRDKDLAARVNLWPGKRRDFYAEVGEECGRVSLPERKARPARTTRKGRQIAARPYRAPIPADPKYVERRSAVKKVAMTRFYGQTLPSAVEALAAADPPRFIERRVSDTDIEFGATPGSYRRQVDDITPEHWLRAMRIRLAAVSIAPRAEELYMRLRAVAEELTRAGKPVRWKSPSGWRCAQDLYCLVSHEGKAYLPDGTSVPVTEQVVGDKLSGRHQKNALPANLIQSLDASLLHIALDKLAEGVDCLATAHDSFGTHADDVPAMLDALGKTLKTMYAGEDLLARIWAGWAGKKAVSVALPERGKWDARFLQGQYSFC